MTAGTNRTRELITGVKSRMEVNEKVGILFGRERWGLENDEVALADEIITFPVNPAFASLNIAQAVLLMSYEWMRTSVSEGETRFTAPENIPASKESLVSLLNHLESALNEAKYFYPPEKRERMTVNLRNIFTHAGFQEQEVQSLHGVIAALERRWMRPRGTKPEPVIKTWFSNFVGFFQLIGNRKVTESHGLMPSAFIQCMIALFVVITVVLAHIFADPIYMQWFKVNNTDDPTSIYTKTTDLAKVDPYLIISLIVMIVISIWKIAPQSKLELVKWHHWFMGIYFIFTTIAFSGLLTLLLKHIFGRVRPNANDGSAIWQSFPFLLLLASHLQSGSQFQD